MRARIVTCAASCAVASAAQSAPSVQPDVGSPDRPTTHQLDDGQIFVHGTDDPGSIEWQPETGRTSWDVHTGDLDILQATETYTQAPGSNPLADRACTSGSAGGTGRVPWHACRGDVSHAGGNMPGQGPLFIGVRGTVLALDPATGTELWRTSVKGADFVNVALVDGGLYASARGEIFALDPATGQILWNNKLKGLGWGLVTIAGSSPASPAAEEMRRRQARAASGAAAASSR